MKQNPVILKSNKYGIVVRLDPELPFPELLAAVRAKFAEAAAFFKDAALAVSFQGRELTAEQEKSLADAITASCSIRIVCIVDERPAEEQYYEKALRLARDKEQKERIPGPDGQFYRGILHAGESLETDTSIVVLGDVESGASLTSRGSAVILGSCLGSVYAGAGGCEDCFAAALVMKPSKLRIADKLMRSAITKRTDNANYALDPKIAYIKDGHLRLKSLGRDTVHEILAGTEKKIPQDKQGELPGGDG